MVCILCLPGLDRLRLEMDQLGNTRARVVERLVIATVRALGADKVHVGYAHKLQRVAQVRRGEVDGAADWHATRRRQHVSLLALEQALGAVLGVAEGQANACNQVDPCFERGRYLKVIDRLADDDDVRRHEFLDELVGKRQRAALRRNASRSPPPDAGVERAGLASVDLRASERTMSSRSSRASSSDSASAASKRASSSGVNAPSRKASIVRVRKFCSRWVRSYALTMARSTTSTA